MDGILQMLQGQIFEDKGKILVMEGMVEGAFVVAVGQHTDFAAKAQREELFVQHLVEHQFAVMIRFNGTEQVRQGRNRQGQFFVFHELTVVRQVYLHTDAVEFQGEAGLEIIRILIEHGKGQIAVTIAEKTLAYRNGRLMLGVFIGAAVDARGAVFVEELVFQGDFGLAAENDAGSGSGGLGVDIVAAVKIPHRNAAVGEQVQAMVQHREIDIDAIKVGGQFVTHELAAQPDVFQRTEVVNFAEGAVQKAVHPLVVGIHDAGGAVGGIVGKAVEVFAQIAGKIEFEVTPCFVPQGPVKLLQQFVILARAVGKKGSPVGKPEMQLSFHRRGFFGGSRGGFFRCGGRGFLCCGLRLCCGLHLCCRLRFSRGLGRRCFRCGLLFRRRLRRGRFRRRLLLRLLTFACRFLLGKSHGRQRNKGQHKDYPRQRRRCSHGYLLNVRSHFGSCFTARNRFFHRAIQMPHPCEGCSCITVHHFCKRIRFVFQRIVFLTWLRVLF